MVILSFPYFPAPLWRPVRKTYIALNYHCKEKLHQTGKVSARQSPERLDATLGKHA
jgi:hypothetical protein